MRKLYPSLLLLSVLLCSWTVACAPATRRGPTPPSALLQSLLVNLASFPSGWQVSFSARADPYVTVENAYVEFRPASGYGLAQHEVYLFPDEQTARRAWRGESRGFSAMRVTPWETPAELSYESPVADQFRLMCADFEGGPLGTLGVHTLCLTVARYGRYVSILSTWPSPEHMSWFDLERILRDVDRRMQEHLNPEGELESQ